MASFGRGGTRHARAEGAGEKRRLRPAQAPRGAPPPLGAEGHTAAPFGLCGGKILVVVFIELPGSGTGVGRFSIA